MGLSQVFKIEKVTPSVSLDQKMGVSQVFKIEKITPSVSPELKHNFNLVAAFKETCSPLNFHRNFHEQIPVITLEKPRKQIDSRRFVDVMSNQLKNSDHVILANLLVCTCTQGHPQIHQKIKPLQPYVRHGPLLSHSPHIYQNIIT